MPHRTFRLSISLLLAALSAAAFAGYGAGIEALRNRDWSTAAREFRQAVDNGDQRAAAPLAQLYLNGAGVEKSPEKAALLLRPAADAGQTLAMRLLAGLNAKGNGTPQNSVEAKRLADQAAAAGDREAHYDYYAIHLDDPRFRYAGKDGKPDAARYEALAARPASARTDDIRAYQHLASGVRLGDPRALLMVGIFHFETVGRDSVARARAAFAKNRLDDMPPAMRKFPKIVEDIAARGPTRTSPKLFLDATQTGLMKVALALSQTDRTARLDACSDLGLPTVQSSGPLRNASFLPIQGEELAEAYLLRGQWTERWVFTACGKRFPLDVEFDADGFGGARFSFRDAT